MTEKMLSKILSKEECAKCRICCCFDSYDIWETPYISQTLASKILQEYAPKQEFIKKENHFLFKMDKEQNADLAAAYGDDLAAYYTHYMGCGHGEGRVCH